MKAKFLLALLSSIFLLLPAQAQKKANSTKAEADIRAVLDAQNDAWNKGNLEEFMKGYWRSPKLTFYSAGGKRAGYDAVLERYRKTYQSEGKEMGKLAFSNVEVEMLGKKAAFVRGRFDLTLSDGKKLGGLYTLVLRQFKKDGWKIVHDHTSSD
ncbi:MAG TPA: nuclear transport factor 2 family protein [Blastocatellia bacterium]|nr:nuclear transport factor 2 family protein [Blastocatellia bacterium]